MLPVRKLRAALRVYSSLCRNIGIAREHATFRAPSLHSQRRSSSISAKYHGLDDRCAFTADERRRKSDASPGQGIYHGVMNYSSNGDDFVDSAQLLPYPPAESASPTPISMSLTEFHFILLYKDRIAAICNLNDSLVYDELLPLVRYLAKQERPASSLSCRNRTRKSVVWLLILFGKPIGF